MADLSVTVGEVLEGSGATKATWTAGEAITQGQVLYQDLTDSKKAKKADADAAASAANIAIALNPAATGQPVVVQTGGTITIGATAAPAVGTVYAVSTTAGGIAPIADLSSGDYITIIGIGSATGKILMRPWTTGVAKA